MTVRRSGLTLIEMMIAIILFAVFAYAVQDAVLMGLRVVNWTTEREDARRQLATALERLTREAAAAYNVDNSTSTRFQFDARLVDNDADGDPENLTNINWRVQNGDLERVQGGTTVVLMRDLASLTFTYLDSAGSATTTANDVRVMQVTASATVDSETITMATSTYLRSL